jgi:hypothetical protein
MMNYFDQHYQQRRRFLPMPAPLRRKAFACHRLLRRVINDARRRQTLIPVEAVHPDFQLSGEKPAPRVIQLLTILTFLQIN